MRRKKYQMYRPNIDQPIDPNIKYIPLTQGKIATVDAIDYERLMEWNWYAFFDKKRGHFYAVRCIKVDGKKMLIRMHREILKALDEFEVDHIKTEETLNNRRSNLRVATSSQNCMNRRLRSDNTSGFKGVYLKRPGKWLAKICVNGKQIHLGYFPTKELAYAAYCEAARKYHGDFANLGIPSDLAA